MRIKKINSNNAFLNRGLTKKLIRIYIIAFIIVIILLSCLYIYFLWNRYNNITLTDAQDILELITPEIVLVLFIALLIIVLLHIMAQHLILKVISKKLTRDEALYHSIFNQAPLGIAVVKDKNFVSQSEFGDANINPAYEKILGRSSHELAKINWPDITHPDDLQEDLEKFNQFKTGQIDVYSMEKRFLKPDGTSTWTNMYITHFMSDYDDNSMHLCMLEDITNRKEAEEKLRYYYEHDSLLGLYRYRYLIKMLEEDAINASGKRALIGINLSSVQSFNISNGFYYTKDLLKKIADNLKQFCSDDCILFRTYESQLSFYIKDYIDIEEITGFCNNVADALEALLAVERIKGGIAVVEIFEHNALDAEQLMKNLLHASQKAMGLSDRNFGIYFYNKEAELHIIREEEIKQELTSIANNDADGGLYLQYQPIYDLREKQICGFEALARMKSEKLGNVPPLEFIPLAEETSLIIPIGQKIIRQAIKFLLRLKKMGYDRISVSINVSPIQLMKNDFTANLFDIINEMKIDPVNVGIEITESVMALDYDSINDILIELKSHQIYVSIDDFGTGFSSLAREHELKVNCLKIDKFFIDKLIYLRTNSIFKCIS